MPMATLFAAASLLVLPFWVLMIVAPRWRITERIARSPLIVLGPVIVYAALVLPEIATILPAVARPDLQSIAGLLGSPRGATIAWAHFLAFDLFVGRWAYLDTGERGVPVLLMGPLLLLVLLLGPMGLGLYLAVRGRWPSRSE